MKSDLPISPNKKFKYSISFESWDEESLEMGETDERGYIEEDSIGTIGDILYEANTTYGIYMPFAFGRWESTYPDEDYDYFTKGIRKFYAIHITNEDGTEISDEESDFITYLLSDGRYELNKFRDYAIGGVVLGSIALGVGALITYFYFKDKKPTENKVEELTEIKDVKLSSGREKSVTHTINGKDRKFPIKDAWKREHKIENKSERFEVPQANRKPIKYEMGGDSYRNEIYDYYEKYADGGLVGGDLIKFNFEGKEYTRKVERIDESGYAVVNLSKNQKAHINPADIVEIKNELDNKAIIIKKIGLSEENADYFISLSPTFSVWLADRIVEFMTNTNLYGTREETIKVVNENPNFIENLYQIIIGVLDWLQHPATPKQNLRELTFTEAVQKSKEWHDELVTAGGEIDYVEPAEHVILKEYPQNDNGIKYYWVFIPKTYCDVESRRMGHCGRTRAGSLISLRSVRPYGEGHTINDSHVTIAYDKYDGKFYQVKGKKNNKPSEKYFPYIFDLIKTFISYELNGEYDKKQQERKNNEKKLYKEIEELEKEISPFVRFGVSSPSSSELRFLKGQIPTLYERNYYDIYVESDSEINELGRILNRLFEKQQEVRNIRDYDALENEILDLTSKQNYLYQTQIVDKYKLIEDKEKQIQNLATFPNFVFRGFGEEYATSEDYDFDDMTNQQIRELFELNKKVFNDAETIIRLNANNIISNQEIVDYIISDEDVFDANEIFDLFDLKTFSEEQFKQITELKSDKFSSFGNQLKLYDRDIIETRPSTSFEIQKNCEEVYELLRADNDDFVSAILCGDVSEFFDSWSYYYENKSHLIYSLNKENTERIIDEIVRITGYDKSIVEENGIEYYLNGEDDDFDSFYNIIRVLASAQNSADNIDAQKDAYNKLQSSLEELGEIEYLNWRGVKMTIDLANLMDIDNIAEQMDYYEFEEISDLFNEEVARGNIDLPRFYIDDRYSPVGSSEDFNAYISDSDLQE